jgi:glyoxylase I family protein
VGGATRRDSWRALFASLPPPNVTTRAKAHPAPSGPVGSIRGVTALEETQTAAPITGLSHFQLLVTDVDVSARWYTAALGLLPFAQDSRVGYVALRHRGAKVVVVLTQGPVPAGGSDEPAPQYLDHLAFAVPDGESLNVWADHLTEIGVAHDGIVLENGHPSLQLRDPDGIAIELVAP